MVPNLVLLISILLNICSFLQATTVSLKDNKCLQKDGTRQCCTSFYEENNTCHECIGSYGVNCSHPCKPGFFGPKCAFECPCLESNCDKIQGCLEGVTEGPVKEFDFIGNLKLSHWMVFFVVVIFTLILLVCCIVTVKSRNIKERQQTPKNNYTVHIIPDQASSYTEMVGTPYASTEYLNASFQSQPIENVSISVSPGEYLRMDATPRASTEYLNTSFQPKAFDNASEYI